MIQVLEKKSVANKVESNKVDFLFGCFEKAANTIKEITHNSG
jgi:hypothetical protein